MKLLFDQNLSRKLVARLADIFPDSSHVQFQGLAETSDTQIWEFAKTQDFCIVTQDADFAPKESSLWLTSQSHLATLWERTNSADRNATSCRCRGDSRTFE